MNKNQEQNKDEIFMQSGMLLEEVLLAEMLAEVKTYDQLIMTGFAHILAGYKLVATYFASTNAGNTRDLLLEMRSTLEGILDNVDASLLKEHK